MRVHLCTNIYCVLVKDSIVFPNVVNAGILCMFFAKHLSYHNKYHSFPAPKAGLIFSFLFSKS